MKETTYTNDTRRYVDAATASTEKIYTHYKSSPQGLTRLRVESNRKQYGENTISSHKETPTWMKFIQAFINPFTLILIGLACFSYITDIAMVSPGEEDPVTVIIILVMVTLTGLLRFIQEYRSSNEAKKLSELVETTTRVARKGHEPQELPLHEVVVGDLIILSAGDMIPADMRIIESKDLFISQAALTGESEPVEKFSKDLEALDAQLTATQNLVFMGSNVISGSARGIVIATGDDTMFGEVSHSASGKKDETSFEKGVNSVSWLLIRFMLIMVPIVFVINGFGKGNWTEALLFAISVAVGLTPEMLPMIVTTSLAKGAVTMSKKKTIVKNLNAIQDLGAIDILCTDKTGTLTQDNVVLQYHMDPMGTEDDRIFKYAYLNSYYQTGLRNLMDRAVIKRREDLEATHPELRNLDTEYNKLDEIPFDFNRRRMSVIVTDSRNHKEIITKGAVEEMIKISTSVMINDEVLPLTDALTETILKTAHGLNEKGLRVLAIACKTEPNGKVDFSTDDEREMVLMGYLAFLDPPKESAAEAIQKLSEYGVTTKILTGDNDIVTQSIAELIGFENDHVVLGSDIDAMSDVELQEAVNTYDLFAKLSPIQKQRIVHTLRDLGHTVGFMGDGINDAPAMKAADIGISVDTAVDIAKESSDVILLEKDLLVLEDAIIEGRKTYANMIKYIKMTASSNFGNVFSVLVASFFLPFLPMEALHLILLNLIYDISCIAIPWDNVDEDYLKVPRKWDATSIKNFMLIIGPTSSVFDITTFFLMFFVISPMVVGGQQFSQLTNPQDIALFIAVFQSGWFIESMWSQTLVIHMIRTPKIPFIQSRASASLTLLTFAAIGILTIIPFTSFGLSIGLAPVPGIYFAWLAVTILAYMILATIAKHYFIRKYGELL